MRVSAAADSDDNKFLECAEAANADYLVTGNKRHFPRAWKVTRVVNARELIELLIPDLRF
jgi:predicted nucleic acid-binding protein